MILASFLGRGRSPLTPLLGLAAFALVLWGLGQRRSAVDADPVDEANPGECLEISGFGEPCPGEVITAASAAPAGPPPTVLASSQVCPTAGYLCQGLESRTTQRVVRWDETTPEIQVRVPRPTGESSGDALALQQAAARGINVWSGSPLPVRVIFSDVSGDEDFAVRWSPSLGGSELGHVETQWMLVDGVASLKVTDFALSTRSPFDRAVALDPAQVVLTAAHEMGHALGLPHSDSEQDVMYPTNTARALSIRDRRTMQALYALENGAEIRTAP